jgi:hypothetical protein
MDEIVKTLLTLVILVVLSGASTWLKKRGQAEPGDIWTDENPASPPPPRQPRPGSPLPQKPQPASKPSWEDELRRLLGEELPQRPPPVVVRPLPPAAPAAPASTAPVAARGTPTRVSGPMISEPEPTGLPVELSESAAAHDRALHLQANAQKSLMLPPAVPAAVPVRPRTAAPRDVQGLLSGLREKSQVRRAYAASIVFGPPKALE